MKTLKTLSASLALLLTGSALFAAPIAYSFRVTDSSGNLVPGATVQIGSTALTAGSATTVPTAAGEKLLNTNAAPATTPSITLLDYGTGDYSVVYDTTTAGELYLPLSISKSGSTFTGGNALIALITPADPNNIILTKSKTDTIGTNSGDSPNEVTAQGQTASNGTGIASIYTLSTTGGGVKIAPGQSTVATNFVAAPTPAQNAAAIVFPATVSLSSGDEANIGYLPGMNTTLGKLTFDTSSILYVDAKTLPSPAPSGYGGSGGGATPAQLAAVILQNPNVPISNDGSGRVLLQPAEAYTNTTPATVTPTWYTVPPTAAQVAALVSSYAANGPPASTPYALTITGTTQPVLTWIADPAATGYKILRSTDGATYAVIGTTAAGVTTYTDTTRPASGRVYYHVTNTTGS